MFNGYMKQDLLLGSVLGIVHAAMVSWLYQRVPDTYMDERFHVGQTRLYCEGKYDQWDPMITTPPALYLLARFLGFCGRERFFNSLLVPPCYAGLCRLRRRALELMDNEKRQKEEKIEDLLHSFDDVRLTALSVLLLPVLLDSSFLFYTDLLSLTAVLWGLATACPFHSFLAFTVALLTRQTNIVWAALYCFPTACETLVQFHRERMFLRAFLRAIRRTFLHLLLAIAFLGFIVWNDGSIVLGDKSAHEPVFHPPQLLYFFAFSAASSFPLFIAHLASNWHSLSRKRAFFLCFFFFFSIFGLLSVHCCTMAHPYLLADNRHFTFYLWRRLIQRHWLVKYLLVPVYACSATLLLEMGTLKSAIEKAAFLGATALCLVPAKLLEFRYFIVPYAIWRCSMVGGSGNHQPKWALFLELALHLMINGLAIYLFLERPFRWPNEPGKWQRFMW